MKRKTISVILSLIICVGLAAPAFAASPQTGVIVDGKWKTFDGVDGYGTTLSAVPNVEREIRVDGYYDKGFPVTGGAGFVEGDSAIAGGVTYGMMEELVVPVGTVITYETMWAALGDGLEIYELLFSHTMEDGVDIYSRFETDEDGCYIEGMDEYGPYSPVQPEKVFSYGAEDFLSDYGEDYDGVKSVSHTFDEEGLYEVRAYYMNLYMEFDAPHYFVVKVDGNIGTTEAETPEAETPSTWAADQVNAAITANLVPEALQAKYTQATSRAEFCALAVALYENINGTIEGRKEFTDTTDINVQKCAYIGVVNGTNTEQTIFAPNTQLTREQAATMLSRLAGAVGKPLTPSAAVFNDNGSIASWALEAVGQVQAAGIMGGTSSTVPTFDPQGAYTREQSVITIMRLFDAVK